ncbi:MAG: zinc ribbon domain-containing protein [Deltaproteobacteria bacterium]|nr:zinc ribbon domain-containing protein [Deltaproteobacteria bacterium]
MAYRRPAICLLLAAGGAWCPLEGWAQDAPPVSYEGGWARTGQSIQVNVSSWGADCGPRPQSSSGGGGGRVTIRQADRELVLAGGVRTERSDGCWSMNPRVRRVSHSQSEGRWRTTCRTAADDPKFEEGTYTLRATSPDTIVYRETSRYDWRLDGDHCEASIVLSWSYSRVSGSPGPVPVAEPDHESPPPAAPVRCASPGDPARLVFDAGRRRAEAGERICLRARVVDASGCDTAQEPSVESPDVALAGGCFDIPASARDGQRFRVRAAAGELHAETTVTVQSPDITSYLAARIGSDEPGAADNAVGAPPAPQAGGLTAEPASKAGEPILWLVLVIAAVALLILGVAAVLFRNQRRLAARRQANRARADVGSQVVGPAPTRPALVCPTCHAEFDLGSQFCPHDASRLTEAVEEPRTGTVCPRCHRGFDAGTRYCPHDSEELVPYSMHEAIHQRGHHRRGEKGKICPACAARYELDATFCGKDGSELVLVN